MFLFFAVSFALFAGGSAEDGAPATTPAGRLKVVATTNIVGDVVSQVAGDAVDLTVLIPLGGNPHGYTPTPRDTGRIEAGDVVFTNGFGLEEQLLEVVEANATGSVVAVSRNIEADDHDDHADHDDHDDHDHHHAGQDPHVWFDPNLVMTWTDVIADTLSQADPEHAAEYRAGAQAYRGELEALDQEIREAVAQISPGRRKLVLDHASLDYFAERYGFEVIGTVIPDTTDQAEPSAQAVAQLVEVLREENVRTIFVGGTASDGLRNLAEAVAQEVGGPVTVSTLLTGSLAAPGEDGDSYLSFMRYNLSQIAENLQD